MSNHDHPCEHCGEDLRLVHPADDRMIHRHGKCVVQDSGLSDKNGVRSEPNTDCAFPDMGCADGDHSWRGSAVSRPRQAAKLRKGVSFVTGKYGPLKPPSDEAIEVFEKVLENDPDADMRAIPNQWLLNERARSAKLGDEVDRLTTEVRAAKRLATAFLEIYAESSGVAGFHLNGAIANWDEFGIEDDIAEFSRVSGRQTNE